MKKLLILLSSFSLIGASSLNVLACGNSILDEDSSVKYDLSMFTDFSIDFNKYLILSDDQTAINCIQKYLQTKYDAFFRSINGVNIGDALDFNISITTPCDYSKDISAQFSVDIIQKNNITNTKNIIVNLENWAHNDSDLVKYDLSKFVDGDEIDVENKYNEYSLEEAIENIYLNNSSFLSVNYDNEGQTLIDNLDENHTTTCSEITISQINNSSNSKTITVNLINIDGLNLDSYKNLSLDAGTTLTTNSSFVEINDFIHKQLKYKSERIDYKLTSSDLKLKKGTNEVPITLIDSEYPQANLDTNLIINNVSEYQATLAEIANELKILIEDSANTPIISGWSGYDLQDWLVNFYLPSYINVNFKQSNNSTLRRYYTESKRVQMYFELSDANTGDTEIINTFDYKTLPTKSVNNKFDLTNRINMYDVNLKRDESGGFPLGTPANSNYCNMVLNKTGITDKSLANKELFNSYSNLGILSTQESVDNFNTFISSNNSWTDFNVLAKDLKNNKSTSSNDKGIDLVDVVNNLSDNQEQKELEEAFLKIYNTIAKMTNKDYAQTLVRSIIISDSLSSGAAATTTAKTLDGYIVKMEIEFSKASLNFGETQYKVGQSAAFNKYGAVIHEFGHALVYFNQMTSEARSANMRGENDASGTDKSIDIEHELLSFIKDSILNKNQSLISSASEDDLIWIYGSMVTTSEYALTDEHEFFAESFAKWLVTQDDMKNVGWEILNDFFVNQLPTYLAYNN